MKGIKLGEMNTMKVVKEVDFGMYLDGGDEGEILLPHSPTNSDWCLTCATTMR